jgi:oligoribonuclease
MKFISVDIETTGLNPEECNIVELAAIAIDTDKPLTFDSCPKMRVLVKPRHGLMAMNPFIANMHRELWPQFSSTKQFEQDKGKYPIIFEENVILALNAFGKSLGPDKMTFAGKNFASFDLPFIIEAGRHAKGNGCEGPEKLHCRHRSLDPGSMYVIGSDSECPNTETCLERARLKPTKAHTALGDAWDIARLVYLDLSLGKPVPQVVLGEQIEWAMQNSPVPLKDWEGKTGRNWW